MDQKQNFQVESNNNKLVDGILRNCPDAFYKEFTDFIPDLSSRVRFARFTSGTDSFDSFVHDHH